jgi:hypothetical protein
VIGLVDRWLLIDMVAVVIIYCIIVLVHTTVTINLLY